MVKRLTIYIIILHNQFKEHQTSQNNKARPCEKNEYKTIAKIARTNPAPFR